MWRIAILCLAIGRPPYVEAGSKTATEISSALGSGLYGDERSSDGLNAPALSALSAFMFVRMTVHIRENGCSF
jgi:hypothetical protein